MNEKLNMAYFSINSQYGEQSAYIVLFGIIAVFVALITIGIISAWLKNILSNKSSITTEVGRISTTNPADMKLNNIAAVIAVVHKFRMEKMDEHSGLISSRSASVNMWRASAKVNMPTVRYNTIRKR